MNHGRQNAQNAAYAISSIPTRTNRGPSMSPSNVDRVIIYKPRDGGSIQTWLGNPAMGAHYERTFNEVASRSRLLGSALVAALGRRTHATRGMPQK